MENVVTLPQGTLTLLFSDIEGSTLLLGRLGPAYVEALDGQRQVLRTAWASHEGIELGTEGDSFFVVFETASAALSAAVQAQRELVRRPWPHDEPVRVRMGIHTGSPVVHDGGYVGLDVHRAARIAGAAHGGQVVVSSATAGLVAGNLPEGTSLRDLGSHRLKDLAEPERLFQVHGPGMPSEFPPPRSLGTAASLPVPSTPLIGREVALTELASVIGSPDVRLVTLTGPGGVGKTRLAGALAHQVSAAFPDGVFFVSLAPITSADGMWRSIGEACHVPPEDRMPPALFAHVAHQRALLVLDNLEQLTGGDSVVDQLLIGALLVKVVATSRGPLHVSAEYEYPVPPLDVPDGGMVRADAAGAVRLFVLHAVKVHPKFALTAANTGDVVAICRRMDGLPLAIELAAARTKLLSPHALLARLDSALDMLGSARHGSGRHRTLRDTISWSYDLLDPGERAVFRHLGAFDGSADLDAIQAVAGGGSTATADVLDAVAGLVDASLVTVAEAADGEPRIGMLETIRSYARDQLSAVGELDEARERHAQHYLHVAEDMRRRMDIARYWEVRTRYEVEDDNFQAALRWALPEEDFQGDGRAQVGLLLYAALADLWEVLDFPFERTHLVQLERALDRTDRQDSSARALCLELVAIMLRMTGEPDRSYEFGMANAEMCRRLGQPERLAGALALLAGIEYHQGHPGTARRHLAESTAIARRCGAKTRVASGLADLAFYESAAGNDARAMELNQETIRLAQELGYETLRLIAQHNLACNLKALGQGAEAHVLMRSLLPDVLQRRWPGSLIDFAEDNAAILADLDRPSATARLLGAADAERERVGRPRDSLQQAFLTDSIARARAALTAPEWDDTYQAGREVDIADVLTEAFATDASESDAS